MFFFIQVLIKAAHLLQDISIPMLSIFWQSFLLASFSRKLSSKTVDTIKGIIAEAIIDLSSKDNEEKESVTKFPENEVTVRTIITPEIIVALA